MNANYMTWRVLRLVFLGVGLLLVAKAPALPTAQACNVCRDHICYEGGTAALCDFTSGDCVGSGRCTIQP
jgi:hypothetical protein